MRNFNYSALVTANPDWMQLLDGFDQVKSDCLKPCASSFKTNLMRTESFAMLPAELIFQSKRDCLFQLNALFTTTGRICATLDELQSSKLTQKAMESFIAQARAFESEPMHKQKTYRWFMGVAVAELLLQTNSNMQASMDALFVSIVLESWLFFEAFASDLWVTSVDYGRKSISNRLGIFNQWANPEQKITPEDAITMEFDAKTHPGSFRREAGYVAFSKLNYIKRFYGAAFGKEAERIFEEAAGGRINVLANVRNCIVHSAGKIDKSFRKFLEQTPRFPELSQFKNETKIELTGEFVNTLRQASIETGLALLKHADATLQLDS